MRTLGSAPVVRLASIPLALATLLACGGSESTPEPTATPEAPTAKAEGPAVAEVPPAVKALFKPVAAKAVAADDAAKVTLGRQLYYEDRLSAGQNQSCNTCHQLDNYGVDNLPTSKGSFEDLGARNSPTAYYAFGHVAQFWDGRAATLADQAKGPILNPVEMAIPDEATAVAIIKSIPGYGPMFAAAYPDDPDPITYDHIADAIGTFEAYLVTPSPFDAWLEGKPTTMSAEARKGAEVFVQTGCTACHLGPFLGGSMYQKLGLVEAYETADVGRMEVTANEADKHVFKVPSLRNIAKTGPYFHDGSIASLDDAIALMAKHQLGKTLSPEDTSAIKAFLESLTGEIPADYIKPPEALASGDDTPAPMKKKG